MEVKTLDSITSTLPQMAEKARELRELLLANAVMIGETPAPTGAETQRVQFLLDRFIEADCSNVSTDEAGNALAMIPGSKGERTIMVSAHLDTPFDRSVDHTVTVKTDGVAGPGILDNAIGLATIATLPVMLERLGIAFEDNLLLMGSSSSLGVGDMKGMRFFLQNNVLPIHAGVLVEGGTLGRLSYAALGLIRAEIRCVVPQDYDFGHFGASGVIPILSRVVQRLRSIPLPREPRTTMIFGNLEAGKAYNSIARSGCLKFELRSEQSGMVSGLRDTIEEIVEEMRHDTKSELTLNVVSKRSTGGIPFSHPMVRCTREIMKELDIKPIIAPSTGELAALLASGLYGVTLGMTFGEKRHELGESAQIDPVFTGIAQLMGVLQAIDGGHCDVED